MEIILLRHGRPKVDLKGGFSATELKQLVASYEQSDIQGFPPEKLKGNFDLYFVVCSDLPRSLQSAKKLGFEQTNECHSLFAETNIPHFDGGNLRLPVSIWVLVLRIMWLFGFSKNGEAFKHAKKRSEEAANKLIELAQKHNKVILVGHGLMNRLIAKQLRQKSWQGPSSPGKNYWSFAAYKN